VVGASVAGEGRAGVAGAGAGAVAEGAIAGPLAAGTGTTAAGGSAGAVWLCPVTASSNRPQASADRVAIRSIMTASV
jgi:hypothetical protein